ncbi:MAG TPA: FecR domain-containing protein [Chitinophaga sp.]|uniref:FecR family protein n=1 Tax=Chitinophaga sp. TaxID=1869181 RepID=UPI002DBEBF36|nr:FecR domain-containing protein [Chitinophaga sp.]HEU4554919.1 FecR domain-containing protein [Chitinophaga sp.]
MQRAELDILFDQYLAETITAADLRRLWETLDAPEHAAAWDAFLEQLCSRESLHGLTNAADVESALVAIKRQMAALDDGAGSPPVAGERSRIHLLRRWSWAAASIIVLLAAGIYFWPRLSFKQRPAVAQKAGEVAVGAHTAILTLSDGSTIKLDSTSNQVIRQGTAAVRQQGDSLQYEVKGNESLMAYNTLATPRGSQFQVTLSDGTKVWLNAASSLQFPVAFNSTERIVKLTGEAYFEVAGNPQQPFKVMANGMEVQVLGTRFNISAYEDESAVKTTLMQGAVKLVAPASQVALQPGEQGLLPSPLAAFRVKKVNPEDAVAWKNGFFAFDNAGIREVMQQIARWYDMEVVFEDNNIKRNFGGTVTRYKDVTAVLKRLEMTGVIHFKVEGRRIIVMP